MHELRRDLDRNICLHCCREGHTFGLACQKEESKRRDYKMGLIHYCSTHIQPQDQIMVSAK